MGTTTHGWNQSLDLYVQLHSMRICLDFHLMLHLLFLPLCVRAANARASMRNSAGLQEHSLLAFAVRFISRELVHLLNAENGSSFLVTSPVYN